MKLSKISFKVFKELSSGSYFDKDKFFETALEFQYIWFTHHNFYYSSPRFGKKWKSGDYCQFHKIETCCNICGKQPERNHAGVGDLFIMKKKSGFILLCYNHIENGTEWKVPRYLKNNQLKLF